MQQFARESYVWGAAWSGSATEGERRQVGASMLWRRGADSNRRIEVLQTSPLASWVPRPVRIIGQFVEAVNADLRAVSELKRRGVASRSSHNPSG